MRLLTIMVVFLLIGVFFIISEKGLNVAKTQDLQVLKNDYGRWIINTAKNTAAFAGQVVKMDWMPKTIDEENASKTNTTVNASG